jgi:hypothetical protein
VVADRRIATATATEKAMVEVRVSLRDVLLSACLVTAMAGTARAADDENVVSRLSSNGGLSSSAAKKLVSKVNVRMAKAADATAAMNDPMRAAVSLALFQSPTPPNSMAAAKVRLRLYAGLNEWALEAIFAPQPGVIAGCVREVGASQSECEALVAAAAKSSVAQIRSVAGGSAAPVAAAPAQQYGGGGYANAPAANGGSRFGRFNSGYQQAPVAAPRYGAAPAYGYQQPQQYRPMPQQQYGGYPQQQYRPMPQQQYGGYPQQQYQRPMPQQQYRPMPPQQQFARPAAPVAPPPPAAPVISQADAQARKEAYKAQREAYLARQKQLFEEKKQKVAQVHEADRAEAPPRNGVETPAPAAPAAAPMSKPAPVASAKPSKAAPPSDLDDAPSEPVAAKSTSKPALDNDFLDGLLDDPLANKKGK